MTTKLKPAERQKIHNSILLSQLFLESLKSQDNTELLQEQILAFQRKTITTLPQDSQQWVLKELAKEKLNSLPALFRQHLEVLPGVPENIYMELTKILDFMYTFKSRMKRVDYEKYRLLFAFIRQELGAEMTNGETCLSHSESNLTFKFAQPKNGPDDE